MRLHLVRHGDGLPSRPATTRRRAGRAASHRAGRLVAVADRATGGDTGPDVAATEEAHSAAAGAALRRISTSERAISAQELAERVGHPAALPRLSPLAKGRAAATRHDIHIERVWPMRSPSTGRLEDPSSASFQPSRRGTPPARRVPVEGLRMNQAFSHEPVMAAEVVDLLAAVPPGLVLDATLGGAGHARLLLDAAPGITLLGIDRDPTAVAAASHALAGYGDRATVRRSRFDDLADVVRSVQEAQGIPLAERGLVGALFDLGVSSPQLDTADRGFSYRRDAPLDMRMDPTVGQTAADIVNGCDEDTLVQLFVDNGETRFARRIARAIIAARPIVTTGELADVVRAAIPAATRRTGGHPARRVFQAIRIAVNEELDQLQTGLDAVLDLLRPGGRCVVISYHSGEDRLVKTTFTRAATDDCHCPPALPCVCGADPRFTLVTRGSRKPGAAEVERNHRAEAARLRALECTAPSARHASGSGEVA